MLRMSAQMLISTTATFGLAMVVLMGCRNQADGAEKVWTKVDKVIDVSFTDRPFDDAIEEISKHLNIPIRIDRDGLDDVDGTAREPFQVTFNQLTGGALLSLMLESRGLTWDIDNNGLVVTSIERMERNRQTEIHALSVLGPIGRQGKDLSDVLREVTSGIDGITWETVERIESSIEATPGKLTVVQHRAGQEVIADALRQMRRLTSRRAYPLTEHEESDKYLNSLLQKRGSCDFDQTSLQSAVNVFVKLHQLPIWFDYVSLSSQQKSNDQPVTHRAANLPLSELLDGLLHPLDMDWQVRDEVVYIAMRDDIDAAYTLQIHEVGSLLMKTGGEAQLLKEIKDLDNQWKWGDDSGVGRVWNNFLFIRQTPSAQRRISSHLKSR